MKKHQQLARELMVVERAAWWNPRVRRILKAAPLVVIFLLLNTRAAHASCSFSPTPDPTVDGSSKSLRHAIRAANASGADCTIELQAGTYTLTIKNTNGQENAAAEGDLDIINSGHTITIEGKGAGVSIVNGNSIDRVFQVLGGANAVIAKLTIEGGVARDDGSAGALFTDADGGGLLVQGGGHVTLSAVSVKGNQAIGQLLTTAGVPQTPHPGAGGGLFVSKGAVELRDSKISGNNAFGSAGGLGSASLFGEDGDSGTGGGLYVASGSVTLLRATVSANRAIGGHGGSGVSSAANGGIGWGAGLFIHGGAVSLKQTNVSGNVARGGTGASFNGGPGGSSRGAGIFATAGTISLANSTLFGNTAKGGQGGADGCFFPPSGCPPGSGGDASGGGLFVRSGTVVLAGVTVASNRVLTQFEHAPRGSSSGGGLVNVGAGVITNVTLIGNNTQDSGKASNGDDVLGPITPSHSLIGQTVGANIIDEGGNIFNVDPRLDPNGLQFNGGPTKTVALQSDSPAIDAVPVADCTDLAFPPHPLTTDQRGLPRPDGAEKVCDMGAYESQ